MYSNRPGTGVRSESTGRQILAASRVPSDTVIQTCSSTATSWGSESTSWSTPTSTLSSGGELEGQAFDTARVLVHQFPLIPSADEHVGELVAVAVLARQLGQPPTLLRDHIDLDAVELTPQAIVVLRDLCLGHQRIGEQSTLHPGG